MKEFLLKTVKESVKKNWGTGIFLDGYSSFFPAGSIRRFFFSLHWENLLEVLEVKFTKVWKVLNSYTHSLWASRNLSVLEQAFFSWTVPAEGSALVGCDSLYLPICLQDSHLPCDLTSQQIQVESLIFQFVQLFTWVRMERYHPSSLHAKLEPGSVSSLFSYLLSFHTLEYALYNGRGFSLFLSVVHGCILHA